ncbi:hypothetical protein GLOIN_2v1779036 [Rhizophagus clarus]|uniref:Uncharacterized protein n=1 Tax=Rhizophagus clarus TaxID=94130 RepID=A0A8H3KWU3_9GLOM|nr:hypothetical protein GLOIN_2v1779036 [Rhizophagus clarus]
MHWSNTSENDAEIEVIDDPGFSIGDDFQIHSHFANPPPICLIPRIDGYVKRYKHVGTRENSFISPISYAIFRLDLITPNVSLILPCDYMIARSKNCCILQFPCGLINNEETFIVVVFYATAKILYQLDKGLSVSIIFILSMERIKKRFVYHNLNTVRSVCESQDLPGTFTTSDLPCSPNFSCVDFILPNDQSPFAICISDDRRNTWDNDHNRGVICAPTRTFRLSAKTITIGMTTYDTNLNPIQVNMLDGYVNNDFLGIAFQQHNFSKTYNNYDESKGIKMCFGAGSEQEVTAVYGILIPGSTINELTIVSSE